MFTNITEKLKISAKVIFTIGIILSFISLIAIGELGWAFIIVVLISFFSMWFTSILIYAFAELLEHTKAIRENTSKPTITQKKLTNEQVSNQEEL